MQKHNWLIAITGIAITTSITASAAMTGQYYVNVTALNPSVSAPVTLTDCTNQESIPVTTPSAPSCVIPASGVIITQDAQQCQLGGSSQTCAVTSSGSTLIVTGWGSSGGGGGGGGDRTITISNKTSNPSLTMYMGFVGNTLACYKKSDFSFCAFNTSNPYVCQFSVTQSAPQVISLNKSCQVSIAFTADNVPWGACPTGLAEFTLNGMIGDEAQDTMDVSLVNGINYNIAIATNGSGGQSLIDTSTKKYPDYKGLLGVYPLGCDECALSSSPPTWTNCPGKQYNQYCQGGTQFNPITPCQLSIPSDNNAYTVTFSDK